MTNCGIETWPAVRVLATLLLFALAHASTKPHFQERVTSYSEIMKGLSLNFNDESGSRDSRESSDCNNTESMTVNCNLDCRCVDGKWQCCRLRKNINMMTKAEVGRFTAAFVKVANDPRYSPAFTALSWSHAVLTCTFLLEKNGFVFSTKPNLYYTAIGYHNMLIYALENLLRLVDCGVTVPYWDSTPFTDQNFSSNIPDGFGTIGVAPDFCLRDGPFRKGAFKVPKFNYMGKALPYPDCIMRRPWIVQPFGYQVFQTMLTAKPEMAVLMEDTIYQEFDQAFHLGIGGSFLGLSAAMDPLLYMLHNYGNKMIASYQIQGPNHYTGGGRWANDLPLTAFPWYKAKDFLDYFNYPNGVCIRWAASMDRGEAIKKGYYAGLEIPRHDHLSFSYQHVRELPISDSEANGMAIFLTGVRARFKSFTLDSEGPWISKNWQHELPPKSLLKPQGASLGLCRKALVMDPEFLRYNISTELEELL